MDKRIMVEDIDGWAVIVADAEHGMVSLEIDTLEGQSLMAILSPAQWRELSTFIERGARDGA